MNKVNSSKCYLATISKETKKRPTTDGGKKDDIELKISTCTVVGGENKRTRCDDEEDWLHVEGKKRSSEDVCSKGLSTFERSADILLLSANFLDVEETNDSVGSIRTDYIRDTEIASDEFKKVLRATI